MTIASLETGLEHIDDELCRSFLVHVEVAGRKWNGAILLAGVRGARRFSEYREVVTGISDRLLAQRFRELELEGLLARTVTPTTPVLVQYEPTDYGRDLLRALQPLTHLTRKK